MLALLRFVLSVCVGALVLFVPALASADLPGGAKVAFDELLIRKPGSATLVIGNEEEDRRYFNRAHCLCSPDGAAPSDYVETEFVLEVKLTNRTVAVNKPGEIYTGADCSTTTSRPMCELVGTIGDLDVITNTPNRTPVRIHKLVSPKAASAQERCTALERQGLVWVGADGDSNGDLEYWVSKGVDLDTNPPPPPTDVTARPGESGINLTWTNSKDRQTDLYRYQFLCARIDGASPAPALAKVSDEPLFQSAAALCGNTSGDIAFTGTGTRPSWLADPERFVCGETAGTNTSYRINGLANGVKHQVAIVAIDRAGNAAGVYLDGELTPEEVTDFWEDLHERDAGIEGGYCLIAQTFGDDSGLSQALRQFRDETLASTAAGRWLTARYYQTSDVLGPRLDAGWARAAAALALTPFIVIALVWHALSLPGLLALVVIALAVRRALRSVRRRPALGGRVARAASLALLVAAALAPTAARAQSVGPYWEDDLVTDSDAPAGTSWHVGLRVGPYLPAIDDMVAGEPYSDTFGGSGWLPMIDVDYVVSDRFGQLTIGASGGFLGASGNTFKIVTDETTGEMTRVETTDKTRFRLIPASLSASFRLTLLDDRFGVPIIPYARGGVAYYTWWIEAPNGEVASVCRAGGTSCDENLARGGSLGLVGSLGLSIRAERIDSEAAAAMREGGVLHAGFYAEVSAAKVDDFGIGNKLSVGDVTWFAGVDFEF